MRKIFLTVATLLIYALLGSAMVLSFGPFKGFWLQFPILVLLIQGSASASSRLKAFWIGFFFGFGQYFVGLSYLFLALFYEGEMGVALALSLFLAFVVVLALFHALSTSCIHWFYQTSTSHLRFVMASASVWALFEWLRAWLFTGFPGLSLGFAHIEWFLKYWAPIGGVTLISFWVVWISTSLTIWRAKPLLASVLILIPLISIFPLSAISWTNFSGKKLKVALVQGGAIEQLRYGRGSSFLLQDRYQMIMDQFPSKPTDLIILPENSIPIAFQDLRTDLLRTLETAMQKTGADILFGASYWLNPNTLLYANSVLHLRSNTDITTWNNALRYDKIHLIPFAEYTPDWFTWLSNANLPIAFNNIRAGKISQPLFTIKTIPLAVSICYEFLFGDEIRQRVPHAQILINVGNSDWFKRGLSIPQEQQISRMRAIENGRFVIRTDHIGMTEVIDHLGDTRAMLPAYEPALLRTTVPGRVGSTPYTIYGETPWVIVWGILCMLGCRFKHFQKHSKS